MLLQYWYLVEVSTEKQCANECYSSAKQSAPSPHLTKTLLVVSAAAVFSWLPHAIILNMTAAHMVSVPIIIFHCFYILTYSSSFVNPIIYALKIPEFRQSLVTLCSRRRAVDRMDRTRYGYCWFDRTRNINNWSQLHAAELWTRVYGHQIVIAQNCKKGLPFPPTTRCNKPCIN